MLSSPLSFLSRKMAHIPTKSTGEAMNELLAGRAQAVVGANIAALPFAQDNRIRFLGVTTKNSSPFVLGTPPIGDTLKGYEFDSWFALLAPAGTPKQVMDVISSAIDKVMKQAEVMERFKSQGVEMGSMSSAKLNELLQVNYKQMEVIVKKSGAKVD